MPKSRLGSSKLTAIEVAQKSVDERKRDFSDEVYIVTVRKDTRIKLDS